MGTVAVLCENGQFVATTPFVGAAFVDPPNMAPTPCSGTGSTAEGGCVMSPPIVMSSAKDNANDTDVSGSIDVVDTDTLTDESTTVASTSTSTSTSGSAGTTSASNNVVTWGSCVAAFGSVVVVA